MRKILSIITAALLLSGCAAMFNGATQQISIRSTNPKAKIFVNEAYLGDGIAVTTFKKKEKYSIRVEDSCQSVTIPVLKSFDATTLLGIPLDYGLISIFIVDGLGTGAWQQFNQTTYVVSSKCTE